MTITANDMQACIGLTPLFVVGGLSVRVRITDVKQTYGKARYRVQPMEGMGQAWVEASSLLFTTK